MSSEDGPAPGVSMTKCEKCGSSYNACLPDPHVCGPEHVTAAPQALKKTSDVVEVMKQEEPDGVNMAPCRDCGVQINICLPPGTHRCFGAGDPLGPLGDKDELNDDDIDDLYNLSDDENEKKKK